MPEPPRKPSSSALATAGLRRELARVHLIDALQKLEQELLEYEKHDEDASSKFGLLHLELEDALKALGSKK